MLPFKLVVFFFSLNLTGFVFLKRKDILGNTYVLAYDLKGHNLRRQHKILATLIQKPISAELE